MNKLVIFILCILLVLFVCFIIDKADKEKNDRIRKLKTKLSHLKKKYLLQIKFKENIDKKAKWCFLGIKLILFLFLYKSYELVNSYMNTNFSTVWNYLKDKLSTKYILVCLILFNKESIMDEFFEYLKKLFYMLIYRFRGFHPSQISETLTEIEKAECELAILIG